MLSIAYGIDIKSPDDPFLNASIDASRATLITLVPGKFLADTIPIRVSLRATKSQLVPDEPLTVRYIPDWFPGARFKRLTKEARDKFRIAVDGPFEYVKNAMKVRPRNSPRLNYIFNAPISLERESPSP